MKVWKGALLGISALVVALGVGPFLVPFPPPEGTAPPEQLAGPDSRFVEVDGVRLHYQEAGEGEPVMILLHGFGASTFSWRSVIQPLSSLGRVIAYDRPAFGLTERPMPGEWRGQNPYSPEAQVEQLIALMDALGVERAVLVGNSAGGTVALNAALAYPKRVQALVLVDAAVYEGGRSQGWLRPLMKLPQVNHLGPLLVRSLAGEQGTQFIQTAWHDPSRIEPQVYEGYRLPLHAENWDRALWELTKASHPTGLPERLDEVRAQGIPTLVLTGDDDRIVPTENSLRLADALTGSKLVVLKNCGHLPQEECPQAFLEAVRQFVRGD